MKLIWNRKLKNLSIMLTASGLIMLLLCNLVLAGFRAGLNREYNIALAALVGSVIEEYPDTQVNNLIATLNGQDNMERGELLLRQYGIFTENEDSSFTAQTKRMKALQWEMNLIFIALMALSVAIVFIYLSRRQTNILKICDYMEELVRGNYGLDIQDSSDDELSGLKNEVYKLTVFFREQAERASANRRALADSVADISHQLKTPLTSVRVLLDNLSENEDMDIDTRHRFLEEISAQISSVTWLVATLLKLSRLDAGVVELEEKPLQLQAVAEDIFNRLELNAEWRQVKLYMEIPEQIAVKGDEQWLTEALLNVVKNAIEHSEIGGRVILAAKDNDVYTQLTVQNWGEVIPEEEQKHLFERFYRGSTAGKESVGIGLALAKEILIRHNSYITVESEPEQGTIFYIKFLKSH